MDFDKIVMERYATKLFDGRKLPQAKVDELLELIRYAPSSFNIQPWKIIVTTDAELKEKLSPAAWHQKQITSCSHLLVFCANKDIAGNIDKLEKQMIQNGAKPESIKDYIQMMRDFEKGLSEAEKLS
ncbi:nitroreductase family protein, partial [Candidatus Woesearchaeota archaeon]|nr:nitroreductase family protein [Candidatus Woesearchaeota archaeon]